MMHNALLRGRTSAASLARAPGGAVRWYNPLHLAKLKPHEMSRAAARAQAARPPPPPGADADAQPARAGDGGERGGGVSRAAGAGPGAPGGDASFAAVRAAGEALTLADLIKMQQAGVARSLPPVFFEHANAVRTYEGSAAKVRAATERLSLFSSAASAAAADGPSAGPRGGGLGGVGGGLDELSLRLSAPAVTVADVLAALAGASSARAPASGASPRAHQPAAARHQPRAAPSPQLPSAALSRLASFDLRPRELVALLDRYVVRQAEAKKVLAVAICDHYNHARRALQLQQRRAAAAAAAAAGQPRARSGAAGGAQAAQAAHGEDEEHTKPNVLLLGSTGVGKTYLMRTLAKLIGVPFVRADATKFTATGYVGRDPEDVVRDLLSAAGGDVALAQHGIVYVDEIDKVCTPAGGAGRAGVGGGGGGGNIHTRDVQNNFLKLLEETDVPIEGGSHSQQQGGGGGGGRRGRQAANGGLPGHGGAAGAQAPPPTTISTKHILFIFSGAFSHVPWLAAPPPPPPQPDGAPPQPPPAPFRVETSDLVDAGLEPELVGRLPVRVRCEPLDEGALLDILTTARGSALRQMERELGGYGVSLTMTGGALREVARRAAREGTGARGLVTTLEGILRPFKFELPSTDLTALEVDEATVADPEAALAAMLAEFEPRRPAMLEAQLAAFAARIGRDAGFAKVELAECAREALLGAALREGRCARELCASQLEPAVEAAAAALADAAAERGGGEGGEGGAAELRVTAEMLVREEGRDS